MRHKTLYQLRTSQGHPRSGLTCERTAPKSRTYHTHSRPDSWTIPLSCINCTFPSGPVDGSEALASPSAAVALVRSQDYYNYAEGLVVLITEERAVVMCRAGSLETHYMKSSSESAPLFSGSSKISNSTRYRMVPPMPPKPLQNWLPSCDLSVMNSSFAPYCL